MKVNIFGLFVCFDLVCLLILVFEKVELLMHNLRKRLG